jgi:uncharacterized protein involved in exopolysaccharide biosynthesis
MNNLISQSLRILWYRRRRIIYFTIGVFLLTVVFSIIWLKGMPLYESTTVVTMLPSDAEIGYSMKSNIPGSSTALTLSQTHTEFLLSRTIASEVIDTLIKDYSGIPSPTSLSQRITQEYLLPTVDYLYRVYFFLNYGMYQKPTKRDILINKMRKRITIENVPGSYIINISVSWTDPQIAKKAANFLAQMYIENSKMENQRSLSQAKTFIEDKLKHYNEQLVFLENEERNFKTNANISSFSKDVSMDLDEMSSYTQEKNRLELKMLELDAKLRNFKDIETQSNKIQLTSELDASRDRLENVKKLIVNQNKKLQKIPNLEFRLFELENKKKEAIANIGGLLDNLIKINISESGVLGAIRIIDTATIPAYPATPQVLINAIASLFVGIFLGIGSIILSESISPRIRYAGDIKLTGMQWLGIVPRRFKKRRARLFPWQRITRAAPAAIDKHFQFIIDSLAFDNECKIIQFETFASAKSIHNTITQVAAHLPPSSLIINLDAAAHTLLRMTDTFPSQPLPSEGTSSAPIDTMLSKNVAYWQWPQGIATSLSKLQIDELGYMLPELRKKYKLILIITPPLREFSCAPFLALYVDSLLLVVRAQKTRQKDLEYFLQINSAVDKPKMYFMAEVEYPADFMFR